MHILIWLAIGLVAGFVANFVTGSRGNERWINFGVGLVGAFIGGLGITSWVGASSMELMDTWMGRIMVSTAIAAILLFLTNLVRRGMMR